MKSVLIPLCAMFAMVTTSCSSSDSDSALLRVESNTGVLYVVPDGDVTGGKIVYNIYDNGAITYVGDVSYTLMGGADDIGIEIQPTFSGKYKASAAAVKSATYAKVNLFSHENKVDFSTESVDEEAKTATVQALTAEENAYGRIVLDVSMPTILIQSATITGDTPIGRVTLRLVSQKP